MGCCVSSEASSIPKKEQLVNVGSNESSKLKGLTHESRAPPPSLEEETVKEVLSEIPKPKPNPKPNPNLATNNKQEVEENKNLDFHKPAVFAKIQENQQQKNKNMAKKQELKNMNEDSMSEVSEVCSLSFSESVSTTTNITDKRDNEEEREVRQHRVMNRSPAKLTPQRNTDYGFKRDRVVAQSPTRRFEQSPGKRNTTGTVRLVQSSREEPGPGHVQAMGRGRRDPGESSGRRSRSPATSRSVTMGRSPSARRTNRSPARVKNDSVESGSISNINNGRKLGSPSNMEGRWPRNNNNCSTNESLENPLVSLECFIFL